MAREVRISIDDDELFERMKTRKQALDLSWEEVLHRGLRTPDADPARAREDPRREFTGVKDDIRRSVRDATREARDDARSRGRGGLDPFDPDSIERFVANTVREATSFLGDRDWEVDVERVTEAEDATIRFPFLGSPGDVPANQVPLRVRLDAGTDGLSVEVVTVRSGKDTTGMNAFEAGIRPRIIEGLATGKRAVLEFDDGVESYRIAPSLSWTRTNEGDPMVDEVVVEEVIVDGE